MSVPPTPPSQDDIASTLERTSRSYDALPYTSQPNLRTQPSYMAAVARLFALDVAPVAEARILELGCATGGNIIPLAVNHPTARILGVDVSAKQIASGTRRISHIGLSNIALSRRSFTDLGVADGLFDYIICHGVYSWVSAPLRDAILRVCRERLSPRGIALVSYNVLPGWRMMQALRDCFLLQSKSADDPSVRVKYARERLEFLQHASLAGTPYGFALKNGADWLGRMRDDYIVHEFLAETNEPCTFRDFVESARRHNLSYLAEAELATMIPANYAEETASRIRTLAADQLLATEQYIDMATGRPFRYSLLIGQERAAQADRRLSGERVEALHFIGQRDLSLAVDANGHVTLTSSGGVSVAASSKSLAKVLESFVAAYPGSCGIDDLVEALPAKQRQAGDRTMVCEAMLKLVLKGLAIPLMEPVRAAAMPGAQPLASRLARADASGGSRMTANLRHESVELDELACQIVPLLDGSRDVNAITSTIVDLIDAGKLVLARDGKAVEDPRQRAEFVTDKVKALLSRLAQGALLH
jgi:methyltransferase-like protein